MIPIRGGGSQRTASLSNPELEGFVPVGGLEVYCEIRGAALEIESVLAMMNALN